MDMDMKCNATHPFTCSHCPLLLAIAPSPHTLHNHVIDPEVHLLQTPKYDMTVILVFKNTVDWTGVECETNFQKRFLQMICITQITEIEIESKFHSIFM